MHGNPSDHPHVAWERLPWKKLEVAVYRLQKRIFQASKRGDTKTVHKIQKLLLKSKAARLLAVRRGTQDNQGKKTAGVDGVKSVPPAERLKMVEAIHPKQTEIATDFALDAPVMMRLKPYTAVLSTQTNTS